LAAGFKGICGCGPARGRPGSPRLPPSPQAVSHLGARLSGPQPQIPLNPSSQTQHHPVKLRLGLGTVLGNGGLSLLKGLSRWGVWGEDE